MTSKARDRRPFFWPTVTAIALSPIYWLAMLLLNLKGPHTGFMPADWLAGFCLLSLLAAVLPATGWAFASRGPFAILALGGALLMLYWPFFCMHLLIEMEMEIWKRFSWPDKVVATLLVSQLLLFPLWLWTAWRTAMGKRV